MALRWDFKKDLIGEVKMKGGNEINIYKGNALAIFVSEKDTQYQVYMFFCDKSHLSRCDHSKDGFEWWMGMEEVILWDVSGDTWELVKRLAKRKVKTIIDTDYPVKENLHESLA